MKRVIVECGCSKVITTREVDDNLPFSTVYVMGQCDECTGNGGQYNKSSHWDHQKDEEQRRNIRDAQQDMKGITPLKTKADKRRERRG